MNINKKISSKLENVTKYPKSVKKKNENTQISNEIITQ